MQKALELTNALNTELTKELAAAKQNTAEANQLAANARIQKNKQDAKEIELDGREKALKQCEDPIHAAVNARNIKTENKSLAAQVEEGRQDLAKQKAEFAKSMAKQRADLKLAQDEVDNARENFKKKLAKLEVDRAEMKEKILENIRKNF